MKDNKADVVPRCKKDLKQFGKVNEKLMKGTNLGERLKGIKVLRWKQKPGVGGDPCHRSDCLVGSRDTDRIAKPEKEHGQDNEAMDWLLPRRLQE